MKNGHAEIQYVFAFGRGFLFQINLGVGKRGILPLTALFGTWLSLLLSAPTGSNFI